MAKFELPIYDMATEKVVKIHKRNFIPVDLYIRYQMLSEKITNDKIKSDADMFLALKDLFLETFPELTEEEYQKQTDIAQVLVMFKNILDKATQFQAGNSKNV